MTKKLLHHTEQQMDKVTKRQNLYPAFFLIGSWRFLFTERQVKVIIARTLNWCVKRHKMEIAGYMITYKRLCLVLRHDQPDAEKQLTFLLTALINDVTKQAGDAKKFSDIRVLEKAIAADADLFSPILKEYHVIDNYLVRLITGNPVDLPYYDPYLERLKIVTHKADFCSAADYLGAKGPVLLQMTGSNPGDEILTDIKN